jgi:hypothetical protein
VQVSRQSSVSHLVVQTVATLLQSSMQWCRSWRVSESRLVSAAAKETAIKISRAGIEAARARYRDGMAHLLFCATGFRSGCARGLTSSALRIPAGSHRVGSRRADQHADAKHDRAAEHDLEHRL